jgi:hypothetical protein
MLAQGSLADPDLAVSGPGRAVNDANRNLLRRVDRAREEVADAAEVLGEFGLADLPARRRRQLHRHQRRKEADVERANLRVVRVLDFLVRIIREPNGPVHVRLARAKPDIAEQHILERGLLLGSSDAQGVRPTGGERADLRDPLAVLARDRDLARKLAVNGDGDRVSRRTPAPDGGLNVALQHHVVGEERMNERQRRWLRGPPRLWSLRLAQGGAGNAQR